MKMPRSTVIRDKTRDRVVFIIKRDYRVNVGGGLRAHWGKLAGGGLGRVHTGWHIGVQRGEIRSHFGPLIVGASSNDDKSGTLITHNLRGVVGVGRRGGRCMS